MVGVWAGHAAGGYGWEWPSACLACPIPGFHPQHDIKTGMVVHVPSPGAQKIKAGPSEGSSA